MNAWLPSSQGPLAVPAAAPPSHLGSGSGGSRAERGLLCFQTESFKLSEPYSQCTEDGTDVPIKNIYNAVYSLQVRAGGQRG